MICLNDYQPTYRHSNSVIDLFVIKPHLSAKVKLCQTLTHECVRRDHISVLLDFDDGQQEEVIKREQYNIRKTSMNEWKLITDERFKKWNESWEKMPDQDIDEVWDSFLQVFRECMDEVVPKMTIQVGKRRTKPLWYNEECGKSENEVNVAKKLFKRRNTPNNLIKISEAEENFNKQSKVAKEEWTRQICKKIKDCNSPGEMWRQFRLLTSYQDESDDGVLPLLDDSNTPIFEPKEKCKVLQEVFFGRKHIEKEKFDDVFKEEIEQEYEGLKTKDDIADEEKDSFLNRPLDIRETEAAIQSLKANKAPGPDEIYTNLLKEGGDELVKAIHKLFHKSWKKR